MVGTPCKIQEKEAQQNTSALFTSFFIILAIKKKKHLNLITEKTCFTCGARKQERKNRKE